MMKWIQVILFIFLLAGCSSASYENISVDDAITMVEKGEVTVLDVRTPEEYNSGHIPGSELMPLQIIEGMSEELDKDKKYLIVCRSGNRSQQASDILAQKGFKNIVNMTGGMNEWKGEIEE
jgi:rhodanese-related sulfurtransferase